MARNEGDEIRRRTRELAARWSARPDKLITNYTSKRWYRLTIEEEEAAAAPIMTKCQTIAARVGSPRRSLTYTFRHPKEAGDFDIDAVEGACLHRLNTTIFEMCDKSGQRI
jgi:hypothetical protein